MNFSSVSAALFLHLCLLAVVYGQDSPAPDPCGKFNSSCGECVQYKPLTSGGFCYYCTVSVQSTGPACLLDSARCNVTAGQITNNTDQCSTISAPDTGGIPQPNSGNDTQPINPEKSSTTPAPNPTTSNASNPTPTSTITPTTVTTANSTVSITTAGNITLSTSITPVTNKSSSPTPGSNSSTTATLPSGSSTSAVPNTTLSPNATDTTTGPNATSTSATNVTSSVSPQSSEAPSEKPETEQPVPHHQHFDVASFVGGIVLALGIIAISFFGFKFYKSRTERNYQNFDNYI